MYNNKKKLISGNLMFYLFIFFYVTSINKKTGVDAGTGTFNEKWWS